MIEMDDGQENPPSTDHIERDGGGHIDRDGGGDDVRPLNVVIFICLTAIMIAITVRIIVWIAG